MSPSHLPLALVNALYCGTDRGLAADILTAEAASAAAYPVCSALVLASHGRVTDVTDVPADTLGAQLEHLAATVGVGGIKATVLPGHSSVDAVIDFAEAHSAQLILDVRLSGPSGETVMTARAMDRLAERMSVAQLVILRADEAAVFSGGEISSLDDAQVAAQRAFKRGARKIVVRCGVLPARFYAAAEDPGAASDALQAELYYDGEDFALFESPAVTSTSDALDDVFSTVIACQLALGREEVAAIQAATRFVAEAERAAVGEPQPRLKYGWANG